MREDDRHHVAGVELHELVDEVLEVGRAKVRLRADAVQEPAAATFVPRPTDCTRA